MSALAVHPFVPGSVEPELCDHCDQPPGGAIHGSPPPSLNGAAVPLDPSPVLEPLDWSRLISEGIPPIEYLDEPHIPRGARVLATGASGVKKSLYLMWLGAELSREGRRIAYVSAENPLVEDLRRLDKLRPDPARFAFFSHPGLDLAQPEHVAAAVALAHVNDLLIFDTWSAVWSGDENANDQVIAFDRTVLQPIVSEGCTVVLVDHTGHPQAFVKRSGVNAPRGASAKGQKLDSVLTFTAQSDGAVRIEHPKGRMGGVKAPPMTFVAVDEPDGSLRIERKFLLDDDAAAEDADAMASRALALVTARPDEFTKTSLSRALGGRFVDAEAVVEDLIRGGRIGPNKARAKLRAGDISQAGDFGGIAAGRKSPGDVGDNGAPSIISQSPSPLGETGDGDDALWETS